MCSNASVDLHKNRIKIKKVITSKAYVQMEKKKPFLIFSGEHLQRKSAHLCWKELQISDAALSTSLTVTFGKSDI